MLFIGKNGNNSGGYYGLRGNVKKAQEIMSAYSINIAELFKQQFHINVGYIGGSVADKFLNDFKGIEALPTNEALTRQSLQGVPVWDYLKILPKVIDGTGETFEGYEFPREMVIEAVLPKKIVTTDIVGRDGQVEELMGLDDWQISLRGFIINYDSTDYPETQVKELLRVCSLKDTSLEVEGTFLNILGITHISLHQLNPVASIGYSHVQKFEIEAKSKKPFKLNKDHGILL